MSSNSILIAATFILLGYSRLSAAIQGSPHDFSGAGVVHNTGEICKICHVPHNAGSTEIPLWRGRLGTYATYTLYSSPTLDAAPTQPQGPSKACLTCHDGSIALDTPTSCLACHRMHGSNPVLSNDHPVSFVFDRALAQKDGALHDPSTTSVASLGGKTIEDGMLYKGRLECSSCHDVHATKGDASRTPKLLLVTNDKDKLCLTCHTK